MPPNQTSEVTARKLAESQPKGSPICFSDGIGANR